MTRGMRHFLICLGLACLAPAVALPAAAAEDPATQKRNFDQLFQQMFDDPTDLDATFAFAKQATQRGDYEAAIGALERMLFFNPNLPRVRVELGALYFRIGSYEMARTYFKDALTKDTPDSVRIEVKKYLDEIDRRVATTRTGLNILAGVRYQSNANAGPDGLDVRAFGQDATLDSQYAGQPDFNWFGQFTAFLEHDVGDQARSTFEVLLNGYYSRQFKLTQFDLGLMELQIGPRRNFENGSSLHLYGIANGQLLANDPYSYAGGGGVSARFLAGGSRFEPGVEYRHREFLDSTAYPTASLRSGELVSAFLSGRGPPGVLSWVARVGYDENFAKSGSNSYGRLNFDVGLPITVRNWVLVPSFGGSITQYRAADPVVDPDVIRKDTEYHYSVTLDAPLFGNLGLHGQARLSTTKSTLPNFTMQNFTAILGPTAKF